MASRCQQELGFVDPKASCLPHWHRYDMRLLIVSCRPASIRGQLRQSRHGAPLLLVCQTSQAGSRQDDFLRCDQAHHKTGKPKDVYRGNHTNRATRQLPRTHLVSAQLDMSLCQEITRYCELPWILQYVQGQCLNPALFLAVRLSDRTASTHTYKMLCRTWSFDVQ